MNIKITSRRPTSPPPGPSGLVCGIASSSADVRVVIQNDDGTDGEEITNISRVVWDSGDGREPSTATITFVDVELDVEAEFPKLTIAIVQAPPDDDRPKVQNEDVQDMNEFYRLHFNR